MHSLTLQRLGQTMETGRIERWLKQEGESFEPGDPLYEVETDKVTVEVEAHQAGTLVRIIVDSTEEIIVGTTIAVIALPGESWTEEDVDSFLGPPNVADAKSASEPETADCSSEVPPIVAASPEESGRIAILPRARTLAQELGVDLSGVSGSGDGGTITVADVERAAATDPASSSPRVRERKRLDATPRRMAALMAQSWQTIPQFVQHVQVSADALLERRSGLRNEEGMAGLTIGDLLLHAFVRGVVDVPEINASLVDEDHVVQYEDVNVALAVATEAGLHVPVIHRAQDFDLPELANAARQLAEDARLGKLGLADVEGATITFSNLGSAGVDLGTPLVTAPQAAILFVGALRNVPANRDGKLVDATAIWLSGAFDHRIIDGAMAAGFMKAVKDAIESA
jgi:pyruvate dehydrogenase E2 component (dihydrolipoamide acetyltransferase)